MNGQLLNLLNGWKTENRYIGLSENSKMKRSVERHGVLISFDVGGTYEKTM